MEIKSAEFVISNTDVRKCPEGNKPEYAFIGRSNVGKSSLINMLTNKKGLAMTSQTPGKTLLINHFLINNEWYLVDLPGYGFAQRGKENREQLKRIIENYILDREQLTNLFVLLDCRHEAQKIDLEFMEWLGESGVPFSIIFTKIDKISKGRLKENLKVYTDKLLETWEELPPIFLSSSEKKEGRDEILDQISRLHRERHMTIILVSHSMEDVARYADRLLVMNHGKKVFDGTPREVFSHYKELEAMGLAAPQVTYLVHDLKAQGIAIDESITTVEEAREAILTLWRNQTKEGTGKC